MKKSDLHTALILVVVVVSLSCLVGVQVTSNAATVTDGYPGYPNQ